MNQIANVSWYTVGAIGIFGALLVYVGMKLYNEEIDEKRDTPLENFSQSSFEKADFLRFGFMALTGFMFLSLFLMISFLKVFLPRAQSSEKSDCREKLAEQVCLVEPPKIEKDRYRSDRSCEVGADTNVFLRELQSAYDSYPPFVREQMCSLKKIYLEKEFFGDAWSDTGIIGINKKLSDADQDAGKKLGAFNEQTFGVENMNAQPFLLITITPSLSSVTHTLLHELAHTFDYRYDFQKKGWDKLSEADFPLKSKICLNHCQGQFIPTSEAPELYRELREQGFVSQLAAVSAMEDFAETFAFVVERDDMGRSISVEVKSGKFDPLADKAISEKIKYVRKAMKWLRKPVQGVF